MTATLQRVILSYPTIVSLTDTTGTTPRSWIQLARTGSFVSKRYGKFAITRADLAQMLLNWQQVTPKAPTELPVDWDHLSMKEAAYPGDGAAAGWMKKLELREGGDELWAEVEWTPKAAEAIRNREYQFVSPSFVKDHTHKDGRKIGTTLLAAAITNHPFLEGMQALTLRTPAIAGVHLSVALRDLVATEDATVSLSAKPGQRVTVNPQHARNPNHVGATFEILKVEDVAGDDGARVWLKDVASGDAIGWYPASELEPARAQTPNPSTPEKSEDPMKPEERIMMRAQVIAAEEQINLARAVKKASAEDETASREYLEHPEPTAEAPATINLSAHDGERLPDLVARVARERCGGDHVAAYRLVATALPEMVRDYSDGTTL